LIAHYVQEWLPLSAGFVHALVRTSRHRGVVLARDPLVNRDAFPHRPALSIGRLGRPGIAAALLGTRSDVVHAHFGYAVHDVVGVAARLHRPLVLSLHGHDATARDASFYAGVRPDAVVVPSAFLAERAHALGFERVEVIPAGVDTTFFTPAPPPDGPPVVAFVGRLVEKKGVDVLLAAWPEVRAAVPGASLHVLGEGPLEDLLDGAVHHRPDPSRRHEQVRDLLRSATVVCQPSRTAADGDAESLLLVNLEAQATGRPVVTTRHGGIPEFVAEGASALLVPEGDAAALAGALVDALRDPAALAGGPEVARRFDLRACTARVDDLYDSLR
jgi:glycosyltransferase involved in cell wall biosynthesis